MADALWPESDGDAALTAFSTNLNRLRDLLGVKEAIRLSGGDLSLDPRYCWIDATAFEHITAHVFEGISKRQADDREDDTTKLQTAMNLYRGVFLEKDAHKQWSISFREHLRECYVRCVKELGSRYQEIGEYEDAIECYRKGLAVDELAEEFYYQQMVCYKRLGLPVKAITVYRRCQEILSSILGVEPSPVTTSIYETLKSS